jgi:opine dehydrogenase
VLEADLANLNAILHPPGMVCNAGWIEATGGKFGFYAEGSGPAVARVMDAIDAERLALARALGARAIPFTELFHSSGSPPANRHTRAACTTPSSAAS